MNHLGLFAKYWQPGQVKTRLAATLGPDVACELYQIFLFHLLDRLGQSGDERTVVFSPDGLEGKFRSVSSIDKFWSLEAQSAGDLGDRMRTFFENCFGHRSNSRFDGDPTKVIVIGADCPQLADNEIRHAFELLDKNDVVIGPSEDGGYYLLGMKNEVVNVFDDIEWSTERVLPKTLKLIQKQNKSFALLQTRTDVDDIEGLNFLISQLGGEKHNPLSQNLLDQIERAITRSASR